MKKYLVFKTWLVYMFKKTGSQSSGVYVCVNAALKP